MIVATCELLRANELLGIFAAGVMLRTSRKEEAVAVVALGEPLSEIVKLAALFVFGLGLSLHIGWGEIVFTAFALLLARPVALLLAVPPTGVLSRREWLVAARFGPRGFASLFYAVMIAHAHIPHGQRVYAVIGLVVLCSVIVHSSTDTMIARRFR